MKETCANCPTKKTCQCSICSVVDDKCNRKACPITTFCKHKDNQIPDVIRNLFGEIRGKK
jgi:hypothetical protein